MTAHLYPADAAEGTGKWVRSRFSGASGFLTLVSDVQVKHKENFDPQNDDDGGDGILSVMTNEGVCVCVCKTQVFHWDQWLLRQHSMFR